MLEPPHDPLSDYLEAHSLLLTLEARRQRLLEGAEGELSEDGQAASMLSLVEAGIEKARVLIVRYEEQIEGSLHTVADHADTGRTLFLDVAQRIREFQALLSEHLDELTEEERRRWEGVLSDFNKVRAEWVPKLPPDEYLPPEAH